MKTPLPPDAPQPYRRAQLGPNVERYMRERGWLSGPRVVRMERATAACERAQNEAVKTATPPKVVPITREQASSEARAQFIYMVTGKRIAAA